MFFSWKTVVSIYTDISRAIDPGTDEYATLQSSHYPWLIWKPGLKAPHSDAVEGFDDTKQT